MKKINETMQLSKPCHIWKLQFPGDAIYKTNKKRERVVQKGLQKSMSFFLGQSLSIQLAFSKLHVDTLRLSGNFC